MFSAVAITVLAAASGSTDEGSTSRSTKQPHGWKKLPWGWSVDPSNPRVEVPFPGLQILPEVQAAKAAANARAGVTPAGESADSSPKTEPTDPNSR